MKLLSRLALGSLLGASLVLAQSTPSTAPAPSKQAAPAKTKAATVSAADIADAKAKGLVWANLNSKIYHYSADSTYGTTKNGKFMTEADAKAAGYRAAKQSAAKAKAPAAK